MGQGRFGRNRWRHAALGAVARYEAAKVWKSIAAGELVGDEAYEAGVAAFAEFSQADTDRLAKVRFLSSL